MPRCFAVFLAALCFGQQQEDLTIKLNVDLIQIDVSVVDKARKHFPGLTEADFEVFRDGKRQAIKKVVHVSSPAAGSAASASTGQASKAMNFSKAVRRTIAIYIDDLSLSAQSIHSMRPALRKFVEEQIQPGDTIAIYRASGGLGLFQPTSDKRAMLASIDGIRFRNINGDDSLANVPNSPLDVDKVPTIAQAAIEEQQRKHEENDSQQDMLTASVLSDIAFTVEGFREFPGRKSLVVFSENMQLYNLPQSVTVARTNTTMPGTKGTPRQSTTESMRMLIDSANRCGVSIHTIDPRSNQVPNLAGVDAPPTPPSRVVGQQLLQDLTYNFAQSGMWRLAYATGGLFSSNAVNIDSALAAAVTDLDGYYLIAFQPDAGTFAKSKQGHAKRHGLEIKSRKPGLSVRHRRSFVGITDSEQFPATADPLFVAMTSPVRSAELPIELTPLYMEGDDGPFIRAFFFLDPKTLRFTDEPAAAGDTEQEPWKHAVVEEALVLFDQSGTVVERVAQLQTIRLRNKGLENVIRNGLAQVLDVPIKQPGPYHVRAVVMDQATRLSGSSARFVLIPDLKNKQLAMSDLTLVTAAFLEAKSAHGTPAQRVMYAGDKLTYGGFLYNVKGASPSLEVQVILYRDGKSVYVGKKVPFRPQGHVEGKSLALSGSLTLGEKFAAGEYVMQVAVHDLNAPKKAQYALKSVDFEIRPR